MVTLSSDLDTVLEDLVTTAIRSGNIPLSKYAQAHVISALKEHSRVLSTDDEVPSSDTLSDDQLDQVTITSYESERNPKQLLDLADHCLTTLTFFPGRLADKHYSHTSSSYARVGASAYLHVSEIFLTYDRASLAEPFLELARSFTDLSIAIAAEYCTRLPPTQIVALVDHAQKTKDVHYRAILSAIGITLPGTAVQPAHHSKIYLTAAGSDNN